jgi:hypothetical protein
MEDQKPKHQTAGVYNFTVGVLTEAQKLYF